MRRRLIISTLAVVLVAVAVVGIPLGVIGGYLIEDQSRAALDRDAQRVLTAVESVESEPDGEVSAALVDRVLSPGRAAMVELPDGRVLRVGATALVDRMVTHARGQSGTVVTVSGPLEDVRQRHAQVWALVAATAGLAVTVAVILSVLLARRLARPLVDLAHTAEQVGWDAPVKPRRHGVPEIDRVADQLTRSTGRVTRMIEAERQLATDISHQLRTPLTALSMRLEEILASPDPRVVSEEAAAALAQVERLTGVIDGVLSQSRAAHAATVPTPLDPVIGQQVEEWRPAYRQTGRSIVVEGRRGLVAMSSPGGLAQVIATLVENALQHGAGTVTLRTRETNRSVVVEVTDEGPGVPSELAGQLFERSVSGRSDDGGTGLGLSMARALAESDGGRLELVQQRPAVFAVFLTAVS